MASIVHKGIEYKGRTPESIARRIWGRSVTVEYSGDSAPLGENVREAEITRRNRYGSSDVLARVAVYSN